ncbi:MAG TPA: hypothetical protein VFJ77_04795 [Gaiellaceae bacterium]|nr:hypothetical protein [Gaiellaceae bacterium]
MRARPGLPDVLTPAALAVAAWGAVAASWPPAALGGVFALAGYLLWARRGRPWHDLQVVALLLPGLAGALWLAAASTAPGVALTGLLCAILGHHGRHRPDDSA